MYKTPDFVKVSAKAQDIFASYTTSCPRDTETLTSHVEGTGCTEHVETRIFTELWPGDIKNCYSTSNP